ncbi:hypothetical protein LC048_09070 [Mesobacillus subterraneus]|nr:hypothetical protein [Mesobacillus subterraneus]WLR56998.1 hypothetical protein LC048_09070 [Mesobacillus subterraneus]
MALLQRGAEEIILSCTGAIDKEVGCHYIDTTLIQAHGAVEMALKI